jgi:hypothetical protein
VSDDMLTSEAIMFSTARHCIMMSIVTLSGVALAAASAAGQAHATTSSGLPRLQAASPRSHAPASHPAGGHRHGVPLLGLAPFLYPIVYADDTGVAPAASAQPTGSKVIEVAPGPDGQIVEVQRIGPASIRLTRPSSGSAVAAVRLFLADSLQHVLAQQTLTEPPYSVVLELSPRTAYVGASVTYVSGATSTTVLPYMPSR